MGRHYSGGLMQRLPFMKNLEKSFNEQKSVPDILLQGEVYWGGHDTLGSSKHNIWRKEEGGRLSYNILFC